MGKRKESKTKVRGIARVKKFGADQDETVEEPQEITEQEFELTEEQMEQARRGGKVTIDENGKTNVIGG